MPRFVRGGSQKVGLTPGSAIHVGSPTDRKPTISLLSYDTEGFEERDLGSVDELPEMGTSPQVRWINIDGVHDIALIESLGERMGLHPLVVEDIAHTGQRPKLEEYDGYVYFVLRMLRWDRERDEAEDEQVSLILGSGWVLSLQERPGDVFEPLRNRLRTGRGRVRQLGADYLVYALIDAVVDHYFALLERLGDLVEDMGEGLTQDPQPEAAETIRRLKRELLFVRKAVWPLREVLNILQRDESPLIERETRVFLRDAYDHVIQVIDTIETYRDMIAGQLDVYMSSVSNRMNEVMKVLTMIATIFIPLSFLAGLYGMNFVNMPELGWRYGYYGLLGVMASVALGMIVYFHRKRWL
jgi:magnesium transporter